MLRKLRKLEFTHSQMLLEFVNNPDDTVVVISICGNGDVWTLWYYLD